MQELKNRLAKHILGTKGNVFHNYFCDHPSLSDFSKDNEVIQIRTVYDNPICPTCQAVMTYGRYF